jgi:hypothetical protein
MVLQQYDLNEMLMQARAVHVSWQAEAELAATACDDEREVVCEYQMSMTDGLIALLKHLIVD